MSLLGRLLGREEAEMRSLPPPSMAALLGGQPTASGMYVGTTMAENQSGLMACVNAIGGSMGSLPALAYRRTAQGRIELQNHWVNRLFRRPNGWMTWPDLVEFVMGDVLLRGNALLLIEADGAGRPTALIPLPWRGVQVEQLANGRLVYVASRPAAPFGKAEAPRRYLDDEVFHLKDRSDDGFIGRSRISRAPDVVANAASLQEWTGSTWANQATPCGAVEVEGSLSKEMFDRLRIQFDQQHTGTRNGRRVLVLDNKVKWKSLSVSPEDAEVLTSRRFSIEELARLFGVPPPIIGDLSHGTFTNSETLIRFFAQSTLAAWCGKFEAEFGRSVLGAGNADVAIQLGHPCPAGTGVAALHRAAARRRDRDGAAARQGRQRGGGAGQDRHPPVHPAPSGVAGRHAAHEGGHLAFMVTQAGEPFTPTGFYNWFTGCVVKAGLAAGLSPHGLRKAAARRLAEAGCTPHQIAAITGHRTLAEVERDTKEANQKQLAAAAVTRLERPKRRT